MTDNLTTRLHGRVALLGADSHPHAAEQLKTAWPSLHWIDETRTDAVPPDVPRIELISDATRSDGEFSLTVERNSSSHQPTIVVSGAPFSGVIYGIDELITSQSRAVDDAVDVALGGRASTPSLPYSTFWTWDHSTNWELGQVGHQEIGVFNPYGKPPSGFQRDYRRVVDFCSANRIGAIVIYGFLRDSHGGVEAAQELCRYANHRGVRILPGIAIGAYGGVYWEGDHEYNLASWLDKHPELASDMEHGIGFQLKDLSFPLNFPRSDYTRHGCPSRPENMDWMEDAVSWLVETFDVGGVNIEAGDYGVCGCARCQRRRGERELASRRVDDAEFWSHADMADNFPRLYEAATKSRDDLWVYCELQWDNLLDESAHEPLDSMPEGAIYQHTVNESYWNDHKASLGLRDISALPTKNNVLRSQFACQWNGDERTGRYAFNAPIFAEMASICSGIGMEGLTIWGEPSPYHAATEFSYLAFARFCNNSDLEWTQFMAEDIAPRVGGVSEAAEFINHVSTLDANQTLNPNELRRISGAALAHAAEAIDDEIARRWTWLADTASRRVYMGS